MSSNLEIMPSKTSSTSTEYGKIKNNDEDEILEDEEGQTRSYSFDNEQLQEVIE